MSNSATAGGFLIPPSCIFHSGLCFLMFLPHSLVVAKRSGPWLNGVQYVPDPAVSPAVADHMPLDPVSPAAVSSTVRAAS